MGSCQAQRMAWLLLARHAAAHLSATPNGAPSPPVGACLPLHAQVCAVTQGGAFAEEVVVRENVVVKASFTWAQTCALHHRCAAVVCGCCRAGSTGGKDVASGHQPRTSALAACSPPALPCSYQRAVTWRERQGCSSRMALPGWH